MRAETITRLALAAGLAFAASACSLFEGDEDRIAGERIPVRATPEERVATPEQRQKVEALGPAVRNTEWTQVNGRADHAGGNLEAGASLTRVWTADIGRGSGGEGDLVSTPVVAGGRIYTLDAAAQVTSFDASSGARGWRVSLAPGEEDGEDGFGGGLAFDNNVLFVTTGFGEIVALSASDGAEIWRRKLSAPVRAAPTVAAGVVIAISRDNVAYGYDVADGSVRWRVTGASSGAGVLGGASAAVSPGGVAILPFASGELIAVRIESGRRLWSDVISGGRRGFARAAISDISADPVIQGVAVIAGNSSGLLTAIDGRSGRRGWTRDFGAAGPVWTEGQTLFVLTDDAQLKRLATENGATLWSVSLPEYDDPEDQEGLIRYGGPVLAGGRVLVASSEGELLSFDALTGGQGGLVEISGLMGLSPVVANGTVYVLTDGGDLVALR